MWFSSWHDVTNLFSGVWDPGVSNLHHWSAQQLESSIYHAVIEKNPYSGEWIEFSQRKVYSVWLWIWHSGYYSFSQVGICKCLILRKGENPSSQGWTYQRSQEDNHCSINQSNCDPGYETEQSVLFQQSCCSAQLSKLISPITYFDLIAVCRCVVVRDLSISTDTSL